MQRRRPALPAVALALVAILGAVGVQRSCSRTPDRGGVGGGTDRPVTRVTIHEDGTLVLGASARPDASLGHLTGGPVADRGTLDRLRAQLPPPPPRSDEAPPSDVPPTVVEIRAPGSLPWACAAWVMDAACPTPESVREFRFALLGRSGPAVDRAYLRRPPLVVIDVGQTSLRCLVTSLDEVRASEGDPSAAALLVRMAAIDVPRDAPATCATLDDVGRFAGTAWPRQDLVRALTSATLSRDGGIEAVLLCASRPLRARISFGEVCAVMHGLRDVTAAPLDLHGLAVDAPGG